MREIDKLALRSAAPVPLEELRGADSGTLREQRRSHFIALARFMADCGVLSAADLTASQKREHERRLKAIHAIEAGIPTTNTLFAARMRLLNRSTP